MTVLTDPLAEGAVRAVWEAGRLLADPAAVRSIRAKSETDYVTNVDLEVQEFLRERLAALTPGVQFMGEEQDNSCLDWSRPCWILDPVDGTTNLIHGFPASAVSLGLLEQGRITLGVVYNPFRQELFTAKAGAGAFLNGSPIQVRDTADLSHSLIAIGTSPYDRELIPKNFALFAKLFARCEDIRRTGSAALDLCDLACGRTDGYLERNLKPWDFAGASIVLAEAGGALTDFAGQPVDFTKNSDCLAAAPKVHPALLELIREESP